MLHKLGYFCASLLMLSAGAAFAAPSEMTIPTVKSDLLPELQCDRSNCELKLNASSRQGVVTMPPTVPSTIPAAVGPPAGQRFVWFGADYPACQSIVGLSPVPTFPNPYEYIYSGVIPVPLGSTHASLLTSAQASLSGGPINSAGLVGVLQIRRSGVSTWTNSAASYLYTTRATDGAILFGTASLQGLENLASLPGGTGVPTAIEVRMGMFPVYTSGFTSVTNAAICQGKLEVTF